MEGISEGRINIKSIKLEDLKEIMEEMFQKKYRGTQIYKWLWQKGVNDFEIMSDIGKEERNKLKEKFYISEMKLISKMESKDGSIKFLFELEDKEKIESVFIPDENRRTVCISTQVGCPLGCVFCATGKIGFKRNLKFYEIAEQVISVQKIIKDRITNVVLMGMGEPFLNYNEVIYALRIINRDIGVGARKITVSTSGITKNIYKFSEEPYQYKLAFSINAPDDEKRNKIMPINKIYNLKNVLESLKYYTDKKGMRVTFEYVLFKGFNDSMMDAVKLAEIARSIPSKVNIIPYNSIESSDFKTPDEEDVDRFVKILYPLSPAITVRWSKGKDILAACGQLRGILEDRKGEE